VLCKAIVAGKADFMLDPEFRLGLLPNHMDMYGLSAFLTEEEEPIRSNSQDCRHTPCPVEESQPSISYSVRFIKPLLVLLAQ
jgi:hypothetical protein